MLLFDNSSGFVDNILFSGRICFTLRGSNPRVMITIESKTSRGDFTLYENREPVLTMKRRGWFSVSNEMTYLGHFIEIKPRNIWGRKYDIFDNGRIVGEIIAEPFFGGTDIVVEGVNYKKHRFLLKRKGFFTGRFELYDAQGDFVLSLHPKFNWSTFSFNMNVAVGYWDEDDLDIYELLAYCGFAAFLYYRRRNSK